MRRGLATQTIRLLKMLAEYLMRKLRLVAMDRYRHSWVLYLWSIVH